jgi:hypothetical protein
MTTMPGMMIGEIDTRDVVAQALAEAERAPRRKPLPWSEAEDAFLRQNLDGIP